MSFCCCCSWLPLFIGPFVPVLVLPADLPYVVGKVFHASSPLATPSFVTLLIGSAPALLLQESRQAAEASAARAQLAAEAAEGARGEAQSAALRERAREREGEHTRKRCESLASQVNPPSALRLAYSDRFSCSDKIQNRYAH